jgi:phosphotransferase family enzyme
VAAGLRERAVSAAVAVARGHGVDVREPRVPRDRSNLIVELAPAPVVARVATSTADVRADGARDWLARDVDVATYLAADGAEVVPPAAEPPAGPHTEDGLAIAFWQLVRHDGATPVSPAEAGEALRRLHEALAGFRGELPPLSSLLDESEAVIERLASRPAAPDSAAASSGPGSAASSGPGSAAASPVRLDRIGAALQGIRSEIAATGLQSRPLHGDASRSNLLRTPAGLLWTDFEDSCAGPVEWDLACLALSAGADADEALDAYGRQHDEALEPFLEARRLQGAVWTALVAERHPELRVRAEERLSRWAAAT